MTISIATNELMIIEWVILWQGNCYKYYKLLLNSVINSAKIKMDLLSLTNIVTL